MTAWMAFAGSGRQRLRSPRRIALLLKLANRPVDASAAAT